jgi:kynureninase
VKSGDGISVSAQKIIDAIDERTLLVPVSHVLFKSAYIQDIKAITNKAHKVGATVILDAYHSVGIIPVDVQSLGVDILVGGVLKWLCGGPGGAFLWVRSSLRKKLMPKITGWFAHRYPFAFGQSMKYADDNTRFLNGTPAIPALYAAAEGPKIIKRVGIENIRAKSIHQTALIIEQAKSYGYTIVSPLDPHHRAGTVTVNVPHAYEVSRELIRKNIIVDFREGAGIRIAPHFYTSDEELLYAIKQINTIFTKKTYRKYLKSSSTVT